MEIYQQKNNIREKADNFIVELKNALSEAEDKDREGIVQSYPRKEMEQIGMFKLELDHKTMHGVASKYYDNQVNKNNDGEENE